MKWERFDKLSDKMDAAKQLAQRTWTSTNDLTSAERTEWRGLLRQLENSEVEQPRREFPFFN